ncbi:MAG: hypothetical protein ACLS6W_06200 [Ruminococcus sp.]
MARCFVSQAVTGCRERALSTLAALRSGAGLVKVATTERNLPILASQIYEAVYLPMQTTETGEICWRRMQLFCSQH